MDVLFFVCLIVVIAALFFVRNFAQGNNAMLFVFFLSILGIVMTAITPPEIIVGTNTTITYDNSNNPIGSTAVYITEPITIGGLDLNFMWYLTFLATMFLSVMVWTVLEREKNLDQ